MPITTDKRCSLDGDWTLYYVENKRLKRELASAELTNIASVEATGWQHVDAKVPGNFEIDFERAGIIGDPFFGTNPIEYQKFENLHLYYMRRFTLDFIPDENTYLHFDGIDTIADIYINGEKVGSTDNMLIPFEFSGAKLCCGENEIVVHITPAHIAARRYEVPISSHAQASGYDSLFIRKAPHMFGWDIMPRMLSGGIWRPCYVEQRAADRIDDIFCYVLDLNADANRANLCFFYNLSVDGDFLSDYKLEISGVCGDSRFSCGNVRLWHTAGKLTVNVDNAKLWYPRNYGEPNLYDITATLYYKDEPVYEYNMKYGIRTVKLVRTSTTDADGNGEFCFYINGKRVFWYGTNWVPVDALHSRDAERLPEILPMLNDIGCNCVRCWGGNVYEDDIFYNFCDENGIMVWQDFAHACAINPQTDDYCERFKHEVEVIVKRLRGHASIVLWAGDNEVDDTYRWSGAQLNRDPNTNRLTREVIPSVLNAHDFTRPYLPSSPYKDEEAYQKGTNTSEEHLWGPRDYFKGEFYRNSVCHFASETGYHGCPSPESLKKFINADQLWYWKRDDGSELAKPDWLAHAACFAVDGTDSCYYRIPLMSNQVKTLFKDFREDEAAMGLDKFAIASQISQAEAKKYFIERFRVTKWRRTGIIWWNLIDGWPQISDAVVDYYGTKKLAYHYIKRSQQPMCMMFDEPRDGMLPLHAVSDLQKDVAVSYSVTDLTTGEKLVESTCLARANESVGVWKKPMINGEKHFYLIEWKYSDGGKIVTGRNHYVTNIIDLDFSEYVGYMKQCRFFDELEGFTK